jgi:hypothetical protein
MPGMLLRIASANGIQVPASSRELRIQPFKAELDVRDRDAVDRGEVYPLTRIHSMGEPALPLLSQPMSYAACLFQVVSFFPCR